MSVACASLSGASGALASVTVKLYGPKASSLIAECGLGVLHLGKANEDLFNLAKYLLTIILPQVCTWVSLLKAMAISKSASQVLVASTAANMISTFCLEAFVFGGSISWTHFLSAFFMILGTFFISKSPSHVNRR